MAAVEVPVADQLVERRPDGQTRDAELLGQLALRGDGLAHRERLHEVENPLARLFLLGHAVPRPKWYGPLASFTHGS